MIKLPPSFITLVASFATSVNEKHEINILLKKFSLVVFKYSPDNSDLSENAIAWTTKSISPHCDLISSNNFVTSSFFSTSQLNVTFEFNFSASGITLFFRASPLYQQSELYFYNDTIGYFFNQQEVGARLYQLINTTTPNWTTFPPFPYGLNDYLKEYAFSQSQITSGLIISENYSATKLLKITDILGRDIEKKQNTPLFYIYEDGTVEKKIIIE